MSFQAINTLLLNGFVRNCLLFALTLIFALPFGLVVLFGSRSRFAPLRWLTRGFVWVIRGTPLMLQLFVVFYVPGMLWGLSVFKSITLFGGKLTIEGRFFAALIAFVINYACYFSEIYRGGIEAIPRGQFEAAQVLGISKKDTFFKVTLPQVIKRIVPPLGNEVITLVKDTSLARVIAVSEIFYVNEVSILSKAIVWPLFYIGAFFLLFVGIVTLALRYLEKKLSYYTI